MRRVRHVLLRSILTQIDFFPPNVVGQHFGLDAVSHNTNDFFFIHKVSVWSWNACGSVYEIGERTVRGNIHIHII